MPNLTPTLLNRSRPPAGKSQLILRDGREPGVLARIGKHKKALAIEIMVDGEIYRETVGPFPDVSIEDARNRAREVRKEIQGRGPDIPSMSVSEALDRYIRERQARKKLSPRSAIGYREQAEKNISEILEREIPELTNNDIVDLWDSLVDKPGARQRVFAILRAVLNWACRRHGWPNPIDAVAQDIGQSGEAPLARELQANAHKILRDIINVARGYSDRTLATWYEVTAFTGIRSEQLRKLTWENVDFDGRLLIFEEFKSARFEGDLCVVPASDHVLELLRNWKNQLALRDLEDRRSNHVFPARNRRSNNSFISEPKGLITHIHSKVGFRPGAHQLRKLYETVADELGVPPQHTNILLGRTPGGLKRRYSFASAESARDSMETITECLLNLTDGEY